MPGTWKVNPEKIRRVQQKRQRGMPSAQGRNQEWRAKAKSRMTFTEECVISHIKCCSLGEPEKWHWFDTVRFTSGLHKTTSSGMMMVGRWLKRKWKQSKWTWQMQTALLKNWLPKGGTRNTVITGGGVRLRKGSTSFVWNENCWVLFCFS